MTATLPVYSGCERHVAFVHAFCLVQYIFFFRRTRATLPVYRGLARHVAMRAREAFRSYYSPGGTQPGRRNPGSVGANY